MQPLTIPSRLDTNAGPVTVTRAWFERIDEGLRRLSFEGRDLLGQLRAGLVWFDDDAAPARVELTAYGRDRRLPALQRLLGDGELLVHRAGRRAVIRTSDGFAKVLRPAKLAAAEERARAFAAVDGVIRTPQVLRGADDGELTVGVVPGVSLHDLGRGEDDDAWQSGWHAWADAWPALVDPLAGSTGVGPRYAVEDEKRTLSGWLLRVELARPRGVALSSLRERFGEVMESLTALPEDRWLFSHRDLHDKQIMVEDASIRSLVPREHSATGIGLIDSDTLALADPALDLGNLLAHVRLREAQGLLTPQRAEQAERFIRTVADELRVPDDALAAWCNAASLRLTCVYAFRPAGTHS